MKIIDKLRTPCRYSYKNACLVLIGLNIFVYVLTHYVNKSLFYYLALIPFTVLNANWYWQFATYMFVHAGLSHLVFNMLGLLIFGSAVERAIGTKEFLLFYFLTGILSGLASFAIYIAGSANIVLIGASGAIYAIIFAFAVINPMAKIYIWGIIPVQAPVLVLIYTAISIYMGIAGNSNVAHLTHLAGFVFAALHFVVRFRVNPIKRLIGK